MTQLNHFSLDVKKKLKNYVYALVDPRPDAARHNAGTVFYVGRGEGDRVFAHEQTAHNIDQAEVAKLQRIQEIERSDHHVKRLIISWGLSFDQAQVVEGALIDFAQVCGDHHYGSQLTNLVSGYHNDQQDAHWLRYATVEEINARLAMPTVSLKQLAHQHIGLITLGRPADPHDAPNPQLLGTAAFNSDLVGRRALGNWVFNKDNFGKIKYLLVVTHSDYIIVGAFKITKQGQLTTVSNRRERHRIYWRDSATDKDQPLSQNDFVQPVTAINGITVGPNRKLGDIWFHVQQSGLNVVDNK